MRMDADARIGARLAQSSTTAPKVSHCDVFTRFSRWGISAFSIYDELREISEPLMVNHNH
jgi:hypothetical protein